MGQKNIIIGQRVTQRKLALAKEFRREMTPAEKKLWTRLRAGRLESFHFRRQQVIEPYIVDFYCHRAALVVEIDGEVHLLQQDSDQLRDHCLQALGLRVIRFSNTDVNQNLENVLGEILQACRLTTTQPTHPKE